MSDRFRIRPDNIISMKKRSYREQVEIRTPRSLRSRSRSLQCLRRGVCDSIFPSLGAVEVDVGLWTCLDLEEDLEREVGELKCDGDGEYADKR